MTYEISKEFAWSASHRLDGLPDGHPCSRLHGHNYIARVTIAADTLDPVGFVLDFGRLSVLRDYIDAHLDHRHLNDVMDENPTAEHLAHHLTDRAAALLAGARTDTGMYVSVDVSETPKTWARGPVMALPTQ